MNRFLVLVFALVAVASAADLDWRIVGGQTAEDGQFPYQISMRQYGSHSCGGSIINEYWILTAAHCVYGGSASAMTVVAGTNKLDSGGDTYKVKSFVHHKDFNMYELHNDIALLRLSTPIKLNAKVQIIALQTADIGAGADMVLSGWGRTSYPGNIPNLLQWLRYKTISVKDCNKLHESTGLSVYVTQICCLTHKGEGACHGDSGGPLTHDGKVAGIVSWGRPCAVGYPDVFTRVSAFIDWINSHMQ